MEQKILNKIKEKNNGITLIALVITIIVLLILAGVSIAMLTGQNGILTQAQNAKNRTEQAEKDEKEKLGDMEDVINEAISGIEVEQVTDENPGVLEGTGTEADPYIINSIEDLVFFASNVTNGNTYEGQTVKLGLSLDFNSNKSYVDPFRKDYEEYGYNGELKTLLTSGEGVKPIGTTLSKEDEAVTDNSFCGYFDGGNNVIYNCYINKNLSDSENFNMYGLFGAYLYGEVKNLGIEGINYNIIAENYSTAVSGICGKLYDNGILYNCYVTGNIELTVNGNVNANAAGLIDYNRGKIEMCSNKSCIDVEVTGNNSTSIAYCGGIILNNEIETATVKNSYNSGNISVTMKSGQYAQIGGIVRSLDYGTVENSYNLGNILATINNSVQESSIGGIVADISSDATLQNIYNRGEISIDLNGAQVYSGGIVGRCRGTINNGYSIANIINVKNQLNCLIGKIAGLINPTGIITNIFYTKNNAYAVNNSIECQINLISDEELKKLAPTLGSAFKEDTNNINNGYPILSWQ